VTVKCRLGVDDLDSWEDLVKFIKTVSEQGGVNKFILHARKAFLKGLDPKQNRTIPPLKYDWVLRLKKEFPHLDLVINGGFT
jgi:tRNA-dihydrouridine synthase A